MRKMKILTIKNKKDEGFLRTPVPPTDLSSMTKADIRAIITDMRRTLSETADGVGLSANQVGLSVRLFIVRYDNKFYAVFDPVITKRSDEEELESEGCLSVPGIQLPVSRSKRITLSGRNQAGKKITLSASGILARIFQHETDHLDGILFTDRVSENTSINY